MRFTSQVPLMLAGPNMEAKSQTFETQQTIKIWLIIIKVGSWLLHAELFAGLVLRVGSNFLLEPTFNTSPQFYLQKVLLCRHPCHTWDLGPVWTGPKYVYPDYEDGCAMNQTLTKGNYMLLKVQSHHL